MIQKKLLTAILFGVALSISQASTSGNFTVGTWLNLTIPDSSCQSVKISADARHLELNLLDRHKASDCSVDPVEPGSILNFKDSQGNSTGHWVIRTISALPPKETINSNTNQTVNLVFEPILNLETFFKNFGIGFSLVLFFVTFGISVGSLVNFVKRL